MRLFFLFFFAGVRLEEWEMRGEGRVRLWVGSLYKELQYHLFALCLFGTSERRAETCSSWGNGRLQKVLSLSSPLLHRQIRNDNPVSVALPLLPQYEPPFSLAPSRT